MICTSCECYLTPNTVFYIDGVYEFCEGCYEEEIERLNEEKENE